MSYVLIEQNLEEEDEPRFIYAELDSGRREVRRVEFYPCIRAGLSGSTWTTALQ